MRNEKFEFDILEIPKIFPSLKIESSDAESFLKGSLDIIDLNGTHWDTYEVEIRGSKEYPLRFPQLFEVGNAFPKIADWHVYESDLSCCIDIYSSEILLCRNGITVEKFISDFVIPYLANQSFRIREGYYLYGEYSHGTPGLIEYYKNKLKVQDTFQIVDMLKYIFSGYHLSRTANCPFCVKTKFRNCHKIVFEELSNFKGLLLFDLKKIQEYFKANSFL